MQERGNPHLSEVRCSSVPLGRDIYLCLCSSGDVLKTRPRPREHNLVPSRDPPVHRIPTELLLIILQLVTAPRKRNDLYTLLRLTHVCRFWRRSLIQCTRAWTTIFATRMDRRGFVEMCLERSHPLPLEATVDIINDRLVPTGCKCTRDGLGTLVQNMRTPCEWHFVFESLTHPKHSKRIQVLNADCSNPSHSDREVGSGCFQLLTSSLPQLTTLGWKDDGTHYANGLFPQQRCFLPNLRSVVFKGRWNDSLAQLNNLSSLSIETHWPLDSERFRLFMSNNRSLESLKLSVRIVGTTKGPPIDLSNLKSLSSTYCCSLRGVSAIIRVPALERLSSLLISLGGPGASRVRRFGATGDGISLTVKSWIHDAEEDWRNLTEHTRPSLLCVRIHGQRPMGMFDYSDISTVVSTLMADAHTLEIGLTYSMWWGDTFWRELNQLGPRLKTVRFEVSDKVEPFVDPTSARYLPNDCLFDEIEELVKRRFREGRPFSTVERMIVSEDEEMNRLQDSLWREFYDARGIQKYLASG